MIPLAITITSLAVAALIQNCGPLQNRVLLRRWLAAMALCGAALTLSWEILHEVGLASDEMSTTLLLSASFSLVVILFTSVFAIKPENLVKYPELKVSRWTTGLFLKSSLAWIAYDISYEFLFRGYLFLSLVREWGPVIAMIVTVSIYTLAHIHKSKKEMLMCIPFGVLLCSVTILTENIWAAAIIHISLSVSNEYFTAGAKYSYTLFTPRTPQINNPNP
jgi:membrane protease YdiL (CAAX protease family)